MAISRTANINLIKSNITEQNKLNYDNNNLEIIDLAIKQLKDINIKSKTAFVKTLLEFIGALDTSIPTIIINGNSEINPYFNKNITDIVLESSINLEGLNSNHFNKLNTVIPFYTIKKITTNNGSVLFFNEIFSLELKHSIEIINITIVQVNGIKLLNKNIVFENCVILELQNSIEGTYKRYIDLDNKLIEQNNTATTTLKNTMIIGFKDNISLFKNIHSLTDVVILLTDVMETNENVLFECVSNISNVIIASDEELEYEGIILSGGYVDFNMYNDDYKYELKGLYNSYNITTVGCNIGSIASNNGVITTTVPQAEYKAYGHNISDCYNVILCTVESGGTILNTNNFIIQVDNDDGVDTILNSCYSYTINGAYNILDDYLLLSDIIKITEETEVDSNVETVLLDNSKAINVILPTFSKYNIGFKDIKGTASSNNITVKLSDTKQRFNYEGVLTTEFILNNNNEVKFFKLNRNSGIWDVTLNG